MRSHEFPGASGAPPIILQRRRIVACIAASDAVASLVASLAYGEPRRGDLGVLAALTSARVAACAGAR